MILVYPDYQLEIALQENKIIVLSVENTKAYSTMLHDMWSQIQGKTGGFILSKQDKIVNITKEAECIFNPFSLDCNDKKIINKLYQELKEQADSVLFTEGNELNRYIINYLDKLFMQVPYALDYNIDFDISAILKAYSVKIESYCENLLEQIVEYIKIMNRICNTHVFIFVDLKRYLSEQELLHLYEFVFYEKIFLIIFEGKQSKPIFGEKYWILDEDLCIIEEK